MPQHLGHFYFYPSALANHLGTLYSSKLCSGLDPAPFCGPCNSAVRSADLASLRHPSLLKLIVDLVLQIIHQFPMLRVLSSFLFIFVFAQTNGLYESDIILPEDPGTMLPDGYDLNAPNSVRWDPEDTTLSQTSDEDAVDISNDSSRLVQGNPIAAQTARLEYKTRWNSLKLHLSSRICSYKSAQPLISHNSNGSPRFVVPSQNPQSKLCSQFLPLLETRA